MIVRKVNINDWSILFLFSYSEYDMDAIGDAIMRIGASDGILDQVEMNVEAGRLDEGFTVSNPRERVSVVGIGRTSSGPEFLDSVVHEIFHLVQDICIADRVSLKGEPAAYLAGDISRSVSDFVCELSCPHCRGEWD